MNPSVRRVFILLSVALGLALAVGSAALADAPRMTDHRDGDDLISAGLGLEGLRAGRATLLQGLEVDDGLSAAQLRQLAIHAAWNGLSALQHEDGLGDLPAQGFPVVSGQEWHAFRWVGDSQHPSRVMLQRPDHFNAESPCLVATASSGSRGIYGAIPLVAPWALPRGCAVVYTDKGAGTDFFDFSTEMGVDLSGQRSAATSQVLGFAPKQAAETPEHRSLVAVPHSHSGDHPEAIWGLHVLDAIDWALGQLSLSAEETRIIATGLSNGANAALRAAEADPDGPRIDAVVAVMPNITPPGQAHLFEYALVAALYQPCLLGDLERSSDWPMMNPMMAAMGQLRCQSLVEAGLLDAPSPDEALGHLRAVGFDDDALWLSVPIVALDLWRSLVVNYASAYLRRGPFDMPCGYAIDADQASPLQRQLWWATHPGVPPAEGMVVVDSLAEGADPVLPGLLCLKALFEQEDSEGADLRTAIDQTRASGEPGRDRPVILVHGGRDSLIPAAVSSRAYAAHAAATHPLLRYMEIERAQHFDAFLANLEARHEVAPILPHGWTALDQVWQMLSESAQQAVDQ